MLAPKLEPLGYRFDIIARPVLGSGGPFARAAFMRGETEIHLWARYDRLGGVSFRAGEAEFSHHDHMRALGLEKVAQYPGFDDGDPLGGFKRLLHDLEQCHEFLTGDAASEAVAVKALPPKPTGFNALG